MVYYIVEHNTLCDGWVNCWSDNFTGNSTTFDTRELAQKELQEFLAERVGSENPDDYRVTKVALE